MAALPTYVICIALGSGGGRRRFESILLQEDTELSVLLFGPPSVLPHMGKPTLKLGKLFAVLSFA